MAAGTALVVIDMLNRYEHDDADTLRNSVEEVLPVMQALIARAREQDAPIVYVNDNYDDWSAGPAELCEQALAGAHRALVEPILPPPGAAFITKARHSIFYETSLEYLLRNQGIERLILDRPSRRAVRPLLRPRRLRPSLPSHRPPRRRGAHSRAPR